MLTQKAIDAAKPSTKPYKLFDGRGLYLLINPNGRRYWRFKYRFDGREKTLSFGVYPDVRLKAARKKLQDARTLLAEEGIDPSAQRKADKGAQKNSFRDIAEEWLEKGCPGKGSKGKPKPQTIMQLKNRLEKYVYPSIGNKPMPSITLEDMRSLFDRISRKGIHETANRVRSLCDRVFRYAISTGRADRNLAADLRDAVSAASTTSFAAITDPRRFGQLLNAIDGYEGQPATMAALKLAALVFVRPGELRAAEWKEFDLTEAIWSIPETRMKDGIPHAVPLSKQSITIIEDLQNVTGRGKFVFPSLRTAKRPISENTLNAALRRLGYSKDEMTTHGFRTSASSLLHELGSKRPKLGITPNVIETQLAHKRPGVEGIYNRSHLLKRRTKMMQAWADHLDGLKKLAQGAPTTQ